FKSKEKQQTSWHVSAQTTQTSDKQDSQRILNCSISWLSCVLVHRRSSIALAASSSIHAHRHLRSRFAFSSSLPSCFDDRKAPFSTCCRPSSFHHLLSAEMSS